MIDSKILDFSLIILLAGCGSLKPDSVNITSYPEIDNLLKVQVGLLHNSNLQKEVGLDEENERRDLEMDSIGWKSELSFLEEINPNQSEYVGAFEKLEVGSELTLKLGKQESGSLKEFSRIVENRQIIYIRAIIHEDKDVYVHHKEIKLHFSERLISSYSIDGYQKIMMKDTITFRIRGKIL